MLVAVFAFGFLFVGAASGNGNVYVSRFWHNHQPIYWPEWNSNGGQTSRIQYAWDSIVLKDGQTYGTGQGHPDNNLTDIFGKSDRVQAYQYGPRNSLAMLDGSAGYAISFSGSLIDNVQSLGSNNQLGYSSGWAGGYKEARGWTTPSGSTRMDMVGFTYHHSLAAVLPKEVLRKEIRTFKQVWWKAWGGNSDLSDHSKGFFPTEMAFSTEMLDILVDEGYEWVIVPSHHLSRTCPTYNDHADPEGTFQIKSSPPNRADQLGPSPTTGWWFAEPNPGQAAWNVSPYAYQLHKTKYVDPETGTEKSIIVVPSDDVLSYKAGYSGAEVGMVSDNISPYATDPNRPVIVLPATDGDNAWGGGSSSWNESTPSFFGACQSAGYNVCAIQDFVNSYGAAADTVHVEPGAWIFPESAYGAPYFLKWVEPPVDPDHPELCYSNTMVNIETPGFALKFWSWAVVMTGANWCETAEQIWEDEGNTVEDWKIAQPYDNLNDGSWTSPNDVELAWHIYLGGLDSGFNYYGGLGNDDEVKPSLATRRAIEKIESYVNARLASDTTGPSIFRPQRFPWNPGGYTFGWFNRVPGVDENYLKKMASYFYVWTHVYDVSGVTNVTLKVRIDNDGVNTLANNQNETFAGGSDVGSWVSIPMTMRELPDTRAELNAAADNGEIDYFITPPYLADYYFAKIDDISLPNFKNKLLDYYVEATDSNGNTRKSDIQHVYVEDDGSAPSSSASFSADPSDCAPITVSYNATNGPLDGTSPVFMQISYEETPASWTRLAMTNDGVNSWSYSVTVPDNTPKVTVWFEDTAGTNIDSRSGLNWSVSVRDCDAPVGPGSITFTNAAACEQVWVTYHPNAGVLMDATNVFLHYGWNDWAEVEDDVLMSKVAANAWQFAVVPPSGATVMNMVFNDGGSIWDNNSGADWSTNVNGCTVTPVPPGIVITNPAVEQVTVTSTTYAVTLEGTAGADVTGSLSWTNVTSGDGGGLAQTSHWTLVDLPLVVGTNHLVVSGPTASSTSTNATDQASDSAYSNSWVSGINGGFGFGVWTLTGGDNAGQFIANSIDNTNLDISSPAFGMYANSGGFAQAVRPLGTVLGVGDTLQFAFENNWIVNDSSVGFALMNDSDESLFEFYFYGGQGTYRVVDSLGNSDSGIPYVDSGIDVAFTLTGGTNYSISLGASNLVGSLISQTNSEVSKFRFWNYNAGSGGDYNAYFNDLSVLSPNPGGELSDEVWVTLIDPDTYMPGWWQEIYFGCSTCAVANLDSDLDGFDNQTEYMLGTDPTNKLSTFIIDTAGNSAQGRRRLEWYTVGGKSYDIQYSDNLVNGFEHVITITENAVGDGVETTRMFEDTVTPEPTNDLRFYRIKLRP